MTRSQTLNLLRILAQKNNCEYVEPDEDVLDMLVQFAGLVEQNNAIFFISNVYNIYIKKGKL